MSGGSWYMEGADGVRFNWAKSPTYVCPYGDPVLFFPVIGGESAPPVLKEATKAAVTAAAKVLGVDALALGRTLARQHASHGAGRARIDGKLTDVCAICGHKMERRGFRAWKDVPQDDEARERIASRLGFGAPRETLQTLYFDTKKEAEQWAREEAKISKSAAAEHA